MKTLAEVLSSGTIPEDWALDVEGTNRLHKLVGPSGTVTWDHLPAPVWRKAPK